MLESVSATDAEKYGRKQSGKTAGSKSPERSCLLGTGGGRSGRAQTTGIPGGIKYMSYQALYRKWRPQKFDDVRGQDAIVTTLKNQIRTGRIGHAYLFCGTRGTGKTSVAKIFARAVNCAHSAEQEGNPCNECSVCRSILTGGSMNVFEIDAASNNGVDNIRDIREQVEYPPTEGRYKVYIIDEVHMLSTGAFNALLKTLEEPPSYVIFILATTDPQKIPQTILSRCQRYDFRRIGVDTVAARIQELAEAEGLSIEERAVRYLARAADGSMRDALSLLDQCLAFHYGETLRYENVLDVLGAADTGVFSELYRAVCAHDVERALRIVADTVSAGREIGQLVNDFVWYLRNVLLAGSVGSAELLDISKENEEKLREDAGLSDKRTLLQLMSVLSELSNRMRFSAQKRILFEVELIRVCAAGQYPAAQYPPEAPRAYGGAAAREHCADGDAAKRLSAQGNAAEAGESAFGRLERAVFSAESNGQAQDNGIPASGTQLHPGQAKSGAGLPETVLGRPETETAEPPVSVPTGEKAGNLPDEELLLQIRSHWEALCRELSPANRAVFLGTVLRREQPGAITVVFRNMMNYKIAATNREENGLKRLQELAAERLSVSVTFLARQAREGDFFENRQQVTDEDLLKIHFPVDME